ncbi:MAG: ABC transporter substrate-binding protein [Candidatus Nanopelagicales bacterium]
MSTGGLVRLVRIGQFSESPVLAAARARGLDRAFGLEIVRTRVPSSPAQFALLRDGGIDVAVTSPDNAILYATTDRNPLGQRLPVRLLRAVDGGLGLALISRPGVDSVMALQSATVAVDVLPSGFAILLKGLLRCLGVDVLAVSFVEAGSTPRRLEGLLADEVQATILNAESRVAAEEAHMRVWATSADLSTDYLGTVLAARPDASPGLIEPLLAMWDEASRWLLDAPLEEVVSGLAGVEPVLASTSYVSLVRNPLVGLARSPAISLEQLLVLAWLRTEAGVYAPVPGALAPLVTG